MAVDVALPSADPPIGAGLQLNYQQAMLDDQASKMREFMMTFGAFNNEMKGAVREISGLAADIRAQRSSMSASGGGGSGSAAEAVVASVHGSDGPSDEDQQRHLTFSEGRERGRNFSRGQMGQIAQNISAKTADILSQQQRTWDDQPAMINGERHWVEKDSQGNITQTVRVGNTAEEIESSAGQVARLDRRNNRIASATGALSRYGAGEGAIGALGSGFAKAAGPIGVAIGLGMKGMDTYTDQLAAGASYRQIYGEEAGRFAIKQRFGTQMAGVESWFSGMGRQRGMQVHEMTASMGLHGDHQEAAEEFDETMFKKLGMSPEQSMRAVQMTAENASISLSGLEKNLLSLSKAAVEAGRTSQEAADRYLASVTTVQSSISNTAAAPAIAESVQARMTEGLPKPLNTADNQAALVASLNDRNVMTMAALRGEDPMKALNSMRLDESGNYQIQMGEEVRRHVVDAICKAVPTTVEAVGQAIKTRFPGVPHLTPEQMLEILNGPPINGKINAYTIGTIFSQYGMTFKPGDEIQMFFEMLMENLGPMGSQPIGPPATGGTQAGGGVMSKIKGMMGKPGGGSPIIAGGFDALDPTKARDSAGGLRTAIGSDDQKRQWLLASQIFGTDQWGMPIQPAGSESSTTAYGKWAASTGDRNRFVESLLSSSKFESETGSTVDKAKFNTSAGPKSLAQVLNDPKLLAELQSGSASIVGDGNTPIDIGRVTGTYSEQGSSDTVGTTTASTTGGSVLSLTPEARRFFKIDGPSDAQTSGVPAFGNIDPAAWRF